jgi:D-amino-acid dehydrogenase
MTQTPRNIVVIGAGVVGLAAAIALRRDGHPVTVIDRLPPGEACSFGNSGGMPRGHAFPMATPGIVWRVPGYLADPTGPLAIRWRYLAGLAPFLLRFLRESAPARFAATLDRLTALMQQSHADWTALIAEAGLAALIREDGALTLYRGDAARAAAWPLWQMLIERGARVERIDRDALRALEPAAPAGYDCAVFEPDYRRTVDPYRICLGLADYLQRLGGTLRRETVSEVAPDGDGGLVLRTNRAEEHTDLLVVAAGAWSGRFAAALGDDVPLESARGYHATLLGFERMPNRPLFISDMKLSLNPMASGLRIGGNIEFAGLDAAPDFTRPARQLEIVRRLYPGIPVERHTKWAGDRPMLPDSLPVVGRSPRHPNVVYAFGHGQYGLALAAATGRLVAELIGQRPTALDLEPLRVDRF